MTKKKLTELDRLAEEARLGEMRAIKELQEARARNVLAESERAALAKSLELERARLDFALLAFQGDDDAGLMRFAGALLLGLTGRAALDKAMEAPRA